MTEGQKAIIWIVVAFLALVTGNGRSAAAQPAPHRPGLEHVAPASEEAEPVQCWWRTSASAVRIGEPFAVVLTCAVVEAQTVTVVPDEGKLDPSVIELAPFEVIAGTRGADLRTTDRRFIQYEYELRLVSDSLFAKDVPLPPLKLTYRVNTRVGDGTSSEGIERTYLLPQQSIRVLSLVSADAVDIRDASATTFADTEAASLRARTLVTGGGVLMGLAGLVALVGLVRAASGPRTKAAGGERRLSDRAILRRVDRELAAVRRERDQAGWTPDLAGRALAALRIGANYLMARPPSQQTADADTDGADGALLHAGLSGRRVLLSGSITPQIIAHELNLASTRRRVSAARVQRLGEVQAALTGLTQAAYGRDHEPGDAALDESLASGQRLVRRLAREHLWLVRKLTAVSKRSSDLGRRVWSR